MYFIRSDLLLSKISKYNGYLNLTLRLKIKMTILVDKIKCVIMTKFNNNDVF